MGWASYFFVTKTNERDERRQNSDYHNRISCNALIIPCTDETSDISTGTAVVTFRHPWDCILLGVRASVTTAPTGSTIQVDVNHEGTSVFSTPLTIDAGEKTSVTAATQSVLTSDPYYIADDDEITIDIDQVGSTTPGVALKVTLMVRLYPYDPVYPLLRQ